MLGEKSSWQSEGFIVSRVYRKAGRRNLMQVDNAWCTMQFLSAIAILLTDNHAHRAT